MTNSERIRQLNATAVQRGAAFLDHRGPSEWWWGIDLDDLDLSEQCYCVLGQLHNTYTEGCEYYGLSAFGEGHPNHARYYGFLSPLVGGNLRDYEVLTNAWVDAINARRRRKK